MVKKKEIAILGTIVALGIGYVVSKVMQKKSKNASLKAQGIVSFKEGNYKQACDVLSKIENKDYQTNSILMESNEKLGNWTTALIYLNKCLSEKLDKNLLLKRFEIHKLLDMNHEAFKDLFLVNKIYKESSYNEMATNFLKKISAIKTKSHKITGWPSNINFSDFFETLFFLKEEQDPSIVFLNSKEYGKCFSFVAESDTTLHKFLLGCFYFVNGEIAKCTQVFDGLKYAYSDALLKLIRAKKLSVKEVDDLKAKITTETDPTILYYMSKTFEVLNEKTAQGECIDKLLQTHPCATAANAKIISLVKAERHDEALALIKKSLKEYPDDINLVCISLEYFISSKNLEDALALIQKAEVIFKDDPRIYLLKFVLSDLVDKPEPGFLRKAIEIDPKYFKPYIYLVNIISSSPESMEVLKKALQCARTYDEIFTVFQFLIIVETQKELSEEYPDIFRN